MSTEDEGAHPESLEAKMQARAIWQVNEVVAGLRAAGWDFVAVSIATSIVLPDGSVSLPGVSAYDAPTAITPTLPTLANNLRMLARELDETYERSGCRVQAEGYCHVIEGNGVDARRGGAAR